MNISYEGTFWISSYSLFKSGIIPLKDIRGCNAD